MITYLDRKRHNKYKNRLSHKLHIPRFGNYGIKAYSSSRLEELKIDSLKRFLVKILKSLRRGSNVPKFWNTIQINSNNTALSPESRMGKGKGALNNKSAQIKSGQILFEFSGVSEIQANLVWKHINPKLQFPTKLVKAK